MPKIKISERDLKTVRETETVVSRRFRRNLDGLDYVALAHDLRQMFLMGMKRGRFSLFYISFGFKIEGIDTDQVSENVKAYIMENLRRRFKGRFDVVESSPEADVINWRVFTEAKKARRGEFESLVGGLPIFFDVEIVSKFNVETDHEIYLISADLYLKKARKSKEPRKGSHKKRKVTRVKVVVYQLKGKKKRKNPKRKKLSIKKGSRRVSRSRKVTTKKIKRSKKSRRI